MSFSHKIKMSDFKFGLELELNIDIEDFWDYFDLAPGWKCHEEHCGTEIVSPPLSGFNGLMSVREQLRLIHSCLKSNGYVGVGLDDAGLHVHVDIQHYTLGDAKRLLKLARRFNDVMFGIMEGSRYKNRYTYQLLCSEKEIDRCVTIADLQGLSADERYSCVNMYAFPKHGTVEFRYAGATINWRRIYSLVSLYLRMVAYAQSREPIPERDVAMFTSPGLKYSKKLLKNKEKGKNILFDTLQIKGRVRDILDALFENNKEKVVKAERFESLDEIKYPIGLRGK